jgi:hypothetical protein
MVLCRPKVPMVSVPALAVPPTVAPAVPVLRETATLDATVPLNASVAESVAANADVVVRNSTVTALQIKVFNV